MAGYVLEGEWSGYTASQRRIVHRERVSETRRARYTGRAGLHAVRFTDGTMLYLDVRPIRRGERVEPILGYVSLIAEAERGEGSVYRVRSVADAEGRT